VFDVQRIAEIDPIRSFEGSKSRLRGDSAQAFDEVLQQATTERPVERKSALPQPAARNDNTDRALDRRSDSRRDDIARDQRSEPSTRTDRQEPSQRSSAFEDQTATNNAANDMKEEEGKPGQDAAAAPSVDGTVAVEPVQAVPEPAPAVVVAIPSLAMTAGLDAESAAEPAIVGAVAPLGPTAPGGPASPDAMPEDAAKIPKEVMAASLVAGSGQKVAKPGATPPEGVLPTGEGTGAPAQILAPEAKPAAKPEKQEAPFDASTLGNAPQAEKPEPKAKQVETPAQANVIPSGASSEPPRGASRAATQGLKPLEAQSTSSLTSTSGLPVMDLSRPQPTQVAHTAQAPREAIPIERVAIEVASAARDGNRQFEIRLDPGNLGRIDVTIDVTKDGTITARLVVEKSETLDQLRRDAGSLEKAFSELGLKTDGGGMSFELARQNRDGSRDDGGERPMPKGRDDEADATIARQEARIVYRGFAGPRGVDVRI
jgi:flagellar hook-length control protein FliK